MPSFSLAQVPRPPKVTTPHHSTALSRMIKDCARRSMSYLCTSLMSWFPKKAPKALIAGMHLTRDEAKILKQACQELERFMKRQTEEIEAFPKTTGSYMRGALKSIQERHRRIYVRLDDLTLRLHTTNSKESLPKELEDATRSMRRKCKLCIRASSTCAIGRQAAAEKYWPLIAENYTILLELLQSFKKDLEEGFGNETLWSDGANKRNRRSSLQPVKSTLNRSSQTKPALESKHVIFDETVRWRKFRGIDPPEEVGNAVAYTEPQGYGRKDDFTTKLANGRKRSTKRFHERAAERHEAARLVASFRKKQDEVGGEGGMEEEQGQCYLDEVQRARVFMPL